MPIIRVNDCELYYEVSGHGSETIVFSHSLLFNGAMFKAQVAALNDRYRVIIYDHRGQGRSTTPERGYDMDTLSTDAEKLIEALAPGRVHFVGLSMGGFVGLRLAARRPDLIQSLTLINTSAQHESHKLKYMLMSTWIALFGIKRLLYYINKIVFSESFLQDEARKTERSYWLHSLSQLPKHISRACKGVIHRQGMENELSAIRCPTLILSGSQDQAIPATAATFLKDNIDRALWRVIPNAGHSAVIEKPALCTEAIDSFLTSQTVPHAIEA
ncbi:MAG: alpha/beta fold hydrolase [Gammaproteobacteria bacterium]